MISFRLRTKWQKCRGYVPSYERTPKIPWLDIHSVFATHVETVVLLSQQKPSDRIVVDLDLDELDVTSAETKATYAEIKDYVLKEYGLKVSNLYISQVKNASKSACVRKCGLEVGENYNLAKSEDAKQPNCPKEKEKAIVDALEHFGMV